MAALQDIFAFRNISKAIDIVATGIPDVLPAEFNSVKEDVYGIETTYHEFFGERRIVGRTEYGAPSRASSQKKIGQKPIRLLSMAEHILIEQELLMRLRQPNDLLAQDRARTFLARSVKDQVTRLANTRTAHQVQMLAVGKFWYDLQGKLLQTSSGSVGPVIDFGIPTNNTGQLNGLIDVTWANPAANIFQHIEKLKRKQKQATGRVIENCYYGINIPQYIYLNTSMKQYFNFNPIYYQAFSQNSGSIPSGFLGIKNWIPIRDAMFETEGETSIVQLSLDDTATFAPAITSDVYTLYEGSMLCPTRMGVAPQGDGFLAASEVKYGVGGYAIEMPDPVGAKMVMFDNMMPTWKAPLDLNIAQVAF